MKLLVTGRETDQGMKMMKRWIVKDPYSNAIGIQSPGVTGNTRTSVTECARPVPGDQDSSIENDTSCGLFPF